jgi:hypothetical protein
MDKKIDVKKLQFGSKIDNTKRQREDLFSVKRVVSPEKIELSNGLIIKLLGIKETPNSAIKLLIFYSQNFKSERFS